MKYPAKVWILAVKGGKIVLLRSLMNDIALWIKASDTFYEKQYSEALNLFLSISAQSSKTLFNIAVIYCAQENYRLAESYLADAVKLDNYL